MLRDILCRKKHEVFPHAMEGQPPARVEHIIVWLQRRARKVRVKSCQTVIA